jgi:hypothetical protein
MRGFLVCIVRAGPPPIVCHGSPQAVVKKTRERQGHVQRLSRREHEARVLEPEACLEAGRFVGWLSNARVVSSKSIIAASSPAITAG